MKSVPTPNNIDESSNPGLNNRLYVVMVSVLVYSVVDRVSEWVSEWVLINANSAIFQLYHGENKLIFNEMMMRSALY